MKMKRRLCTIWYDDDTGDIWVQCGKGWQESAYLMRLGTLRNAHRDLLSRYHALLLSATRKGDRDSQ